MRFIVWKRRWRFCKDPPPEAENILRRTREMRFSLNFIVKAEDQEVRLLAGAARPRRFPARVADRCFRIASGSSVRKSADSGTDFGDAFQRRQLSLHSRAAGTGRRRRDDSRNRSSISRIRPFCTCRRRCPTRVRRNGRAAAADEVIKIVNATEGRAFVLSTSNAGMNELYDRVGVADRLSVLRAGQRLERALC